MDYDFERWVERVSGPDWRWFLKILSGNDTLLNRAHQAGPYIPKSVIFALFPSIKASSSVNPRRQIPAVVESHDTASVVSAIWYNNKTRDEARITGWGGNQSPIMDPEATGSLCVFAFHMSGSGNADDCRVWLCGSAEEENLVAGLVGQIEPGMGLYVDPSSFHEIITAEATASKCRLSPGEIPSSWKWTFPNARSIVDLVLLKVQAVRTMSPDERLLRRRLCEFQIFRSVEDAIVLPRLRESFATVDLFMSFANSVANRRKARSGISLELQTKVILEEECLAHSYDQVSEKAKRPDFIFPSIDAYHNLDFPADKLQMLAVKTTCKDRWRQVINEADRIPQKFLMTLQEGVSPNQFAEMSGAGITLVVPEKLKLRYVDEIRPHLVSFADFIARTRTRCC